MQAHIVSSQSEFVVGDGKGGAMRVDEEMMHIRGQKILLVCWSKLAASVAVKDLNEILDQVKEILKRMQKQS